MYFSPLTSEAYLLVNLFEKNLSIMLLGIFLVFVFANRGGPDQMAHSIASDLGSLHFLPIIFLGGLQTKLG